MSKSEIINKIYYDPAGHGSMKTTYEDAKQKDKSISYVDVKKCFDANISRKKKHNSKDTIALSQVSQKKNIRWIYFL